MNDRAHRLALLFRALEDLDREKAEFMTEWKDRKVKLENQLAALTDETLSGQLSLYVEKPTDESAAGEGAREETVPATAH